MSSLKPVQRATLSEQVALQIVGMISAGRWKPGEKLPPESELCRALKVGRSSLREALKSLAFIGTVRMRAGDGTYVAEGPSKVVDRILTQGLLTTEKDVNDLCETRISLEIETAALCAQRARDEDLRNLERLVAEMNQCVLGDGEGFLALDLNFHLAIAASSQNQVLAQLLRTIRSLLQELIMKSQQLPGARQLAYAQHKQILDALVQRNPRKARSTMRSHLQTFQRGYKILLKASESKARESSEPIAKPA